MNPANVPKARPIEDFLANLKQKVYEKDWKAKKLSQLEQKIKSCLQKMDFDVVQRHAGAVSKGWTIFVDMVPE